MDKNEKRTAPAVASRKATKAPFISRYLGIDSHLSERNGSTDQVFGLANERPAGRKLAEEITRCCTEMSKSGYEVFSILTLVSGRTAEASVEAEQSGIQ